MSDYQAGIQKVELQGVPNVNVTFPTEMEVKNDSGTPLKVRNSDGTNNQTINADGSANVQLTGSNATDGASVTPNDAADLAKVPTKGIYLGVSGDVKITLNSGSILTFTGLASGVIHPISVKRVWATGTTATNILAVY